MTSYLSPNRLRRLESGQELPATDLAVADLLVQSQAIVDAYCNLPLNPYPVSLLGATGVVEEHQWRFPDGPLFAGQRRLYPYHWPIRNISAFSISVGSGAAAAIPINSLVINNTERWVEITALSIATSSGLFGVTGWVIPIGGLSRPVAYLTLDTGFEIPEVDDVCYASDEAETVFQSSHEHWFDDATDPTIKVAGTTVTTGFVIDYLEGNVTFDVTPAGRVTASYRHKLPLEIVMAQAKIAVHLAGESSLHEKEMGNLESITDDGISIRRRRNEGRRDDGWLAREIPDAALLLDGFKYWRIG